MYSPPYNRVDERAELLAFMRAHNFCLIVTAPAGELAGSHLPCLVEERAGGIVLGLHMARANPQWQGFYPEDEVMVVFSGPHAYVSPRWYEQTRRVPTWNYAAVHAYGRVRVLDDATERRAAIDRLVAAQDPQWAPEHQRLPADYLADMLGQIVVFEVSVGRIESRWKLSQNRGRREQERIANELDASADSGERALAALTRRHLASE